MTDLDVPLLSMTYLIRWLHVASMAGLFGGAILIVFLSFQISDRRPGELLHVAQAYEWIFWLAIGLLVMTGVGNLGAFGAAVPEPETDWGMKLVIKLAAVGVLALLSLVRTLLVVGIGATTVAETTSQRSILRWAYASTVLLAAGIVALAVWLAHG